MLVVDVFAAVEGMTMDGHIYLKYWNRRMWSPSDFVTTRFVGMGVADVCEIAQPTRDRDILLW